MVFDIGSQCVSQADLKFTVLLLLKEPPSERVGDANICITKEAKDNMTLSHFGQLQCVVQVGKLIK